MSDGNQLPPAGETACPTYFAKRLIQQGGAGGFACRSNGHNQWSASKMNKFPKTVKHPRSMDRGAIVAKSCSRLAGAHRIIVRPPEVARNFRLQAQSDLPAIRRTGAGNPDSEKASKAETQAEAELAFV